MERIAKFLASAGVASRRKAEELIKQGKVKVNDVVIIDLATKIDPEQDKVFLAGALIKKSQEKIYLMLHKPAGYITTVTDTHGRPTVMELLPPLPVKVHPVGRLDLNTEGLLFFTNDGEFTQAITHPRHELVKVYEGVVQGIPSPDSLQKLAKGIMLDGKLTSAAKIEILSRKNGNAIFKMEIHEGRKRQVRRMWEAVAHPMLYLKRTAVDSIYLQDLSLGQYRFLHQAEVESLLSYGRYQTKECK